jgi:hypothetical protein
VSNNLLFPSELIWLKLYKLVDFIYFINLMNFNAEFSILFRLHKIFVLLHPTKSHALNSRSDSTPRILTLLPLHTLQTQIDFAKIRERL